MNQKEFENEKRRVYGLLETDAYRPINGIIRFSRGENYSHFRKKSDVVWLLNDGVLPEYLDSALRELRNNRPYGPYRESFTGWAKPVIITEARFSSRLRTDVLYQNIYGTYAIEIVKSESEKSLRRKEKLYNEMKIKFISI